MQARRSELLEATALFVMQLTLGLWYGLQHKIPAGDINLYFRAGSIVFFLALLAVLAARALSDAGVRSRLPPQFGVTASAAIFLVTLFLYSKEIESSYGLAFFPVWLVATLPVLVLLGLRRGSAATLVQTSIYLLFLSALALSQPIDVHAANMLPITLEACDNALRGINPYTATYHDVSSFPFFYFPAAAAPYCAVQAMGLDPRWINVGGLFVIAGCMAAAFPANDRWPVFGAVALPALASPASMQMLIHGHLWVYWILVAGFLLALRASRLGLAAALLGAALGARQQAVFLAAPFCGYLATGRFGVVVRRALVGLAALIVVLAPAWMAVDNFIAHFYTSIATDVADRVTHGINPQDQISLSGFLPDVGTTVLQMMQAAVLIAGLIVTFLLAQHGSSQLALTVAGVVAILAVGLNPFLNRYFYTEGIMVLIMTFAMGGSARPGLASAQH